MFDDNFLKQLIVRLLIIGAIGFFLYFFRYVMKLILQRNHEPASASIFATIITLGLGVIIWLAAAALLK